MACPVCKSTAISGNVHQFQYFNKSYSISSCKNCGCWFYDPFPTPDYKEDLNSEVSLRHYLETFAGIESLSTISENFFSNYVPEGKKGLEIGCGFGFASHYLESIHGQKMTAYEPSDYGVKGKEILGLNIIHDFFRGDGEEVYDYCISTEVIEHIEDPVAFSAKIRKSLTEKGKVLFSTPDKDSIDKDNMAPIDLALLSPGMHTILFTESSLKKMLLLAGFSHVIVKKNGNTLYSIASQEPFKDKDLFSTDFNRITKYYQHLYNLAGPNSPLQKGLFYRLFRTNVDFGLYKDAVELLKNNPYFYVITKEEILNIQSENDLTKYYSFSDSIVYFYCGILYLNYLVKYEKAAHIFLLSFLSCKKRLLLIPHYAIIDSDIIWQAKLHEGIAFMHLGNPAEAVQCFMEILSFKTSVENIPVPRETISSEAKAKLRQIVDSL
jgi:SAM-dependent methyltransferase